MHRFYVQVDDRTFKALVDRAIRARRNVRDEAALALERAVASSPNVAQTQLGDATELAVQRGR